MADEKSAPQVTPFLWFDGAAEEAARYYVEVFGGEATGSRVTGTTPGGPDGKPMTVSFILRGQRFVALNGGPIFHFNEAVSFVVDCADQPEVDHFWERLVDGGTPSQCGWLKDRWGLSWQIVPAGLGALLGDRDPGRRQRATAAMMTMSKLDLAAMRRAADGA